jgi:exodeoxyribonuclease VII large subunit
MKKIWSAVSDKAYVRGFKSLLLILFLLLTAGCGEAGKDTKSAGISIFNENENILLDFKAEKRISAEEITRDKFSTAAVILNNGEIIQIPVDFYLDNNTVIAGGQSIEKVEGIYLTDRETEVVLISRGGGSFEDLNVFNDLDLAMEVYKSKAVVVTGIGHETDRTLTDYVADVYCHTPTAAAERIIRGYKDVEEKLTNLIFALKTGTSNVISTKKADLLSTKYILRSSLPLEDIYRAENMLKEHKNLIRNAAEKYINEYYIKIKIMGEKLTSYDYEKQLKRGFALVTDRAGNLVKIKNQVQAKDILQIRFADFKIEAETMDIKEV